MGSITDVKGVKVGHAVVEGHHTGCTVVLVESGAVCSGFFSGGAPGTRETDLLEPENLVDKVHAVFLGGGSAFGIDGASGVMRYLEEKNIGFDTGIKRVPIVPSAIIFDLALSNGRYPTSKEGYEACIKATDSEFERGNAGVGMGATVGKIRGMEYAMKGGLGTASIKSADLVVGAIAVVNALGDIIDPETGNIIAGVLDDSKKKLLGTERIVINSASSSSPFGNTVLVVVATNGILSKSSAKRISIMAHDGIARTVRPAHTFFDGDSVFVLSTSEVKADPNQVGVIAAKAAELAILDGVRSAKSLGGIPSSADIIK